MIDHIYIFTGPVQSGKTTVLEKWIKYKPGIGGFLTPDIEHKHLFYDILNDRFFPFQLQTIADSDDIDVGRFIFSGKIFELAKSLISTSIIEKFN